MKTWERMGKFPQFFIIGSRIVTLINMLLSTQIKIPRKIWIKFGKNKYFFKNLFGRFIKYNFCVKNGWRFLMDYWEFLGVKGDGVDSKNHLHALKIHHPNYC
jgi:hypothetical protein